MQPFTIDWGMIGAIASVLAVIVAIYFGVRTIRAKPDDKNLNASVAKSARVGVSATDETKANLDVNKSSDVDIRIGK